MILKSLFLPEQYVQRVSLALLAALISWHYPENAFAEELAPNDAAHGVRSSLSFAVEPRFGNYRQLNAELLNYGFNPVNSAFLLTFGLRGRFWFNHAWSAGASMNFGFSQSESDESPVPTGRTLTETLFDLGWSPGKGFDLSLSAGIGASVLQVGSNRESGSLVHIGPSVSPRIGWRIPISPSFLRLSLGYMASFAPGKAHTQPLWEADFRAPVTHALIFGLESGLIFGSKP